MNLNNAKEIRCSGGLAVPVNPFEKPTEKDYYVRHSDGWNWGDYLNEQIKSFETWLSQQPTLHCSPELNGIYPVGEFGEVVWQFKHTIHKAWMNVLPEAYKNCNNDYEEYKKLCIENQFQCRLFIEHIGQPATPEQKGVEQGEENLENRFAELLIDLTNEFNKHASHVIISTCKKLNIKALIKNKLVEVAFMEDLKFISIQERCRLADKLKTI